MAGPTSLADVIDVPYDGSPFAVSCPSKKTAGIPTADKPPPTGGDPGNEQKVA
jgi:hypothetical protein